MNLLLCGAVWVATEIKALSPLSRCGMESANSLLSVSKPCAEGMHLLGKTLHNQAWTRKSHTEQEDTRAVYPDLA